MSKIGHFRELRVWQSGMGVVVGVSRIPASFPKCELYGLGYLATADLVPFLEEASILGKQLYAFRDALNRRP